MKQILQSAKTGEIEIAEVPQPKLLPGCVLVRVAASLVSAGTERASAEFAKKSLLQKAKARPDLVRDVITKIRRDGILSAAGTVRSRLDLPTALGYSSAGTVTAVAGGITDLRAGDRVACAGAGYAIHAEYACVPRLLTAKILSESTSFEEAAFTTLGAVALHGLRTAEVQLGDTVAVIGLGLMGQLTVQLLKAAGCNVLGLDLRADRSRLALQSGANFVSSSADDFRRLCIQQTNGTGVDAVLVAAETSSSDPVNLAAEVSRDRGTVVAVGTVGMELRRKFYYEKEIDFRVSRSYGPGRYDSSYEQKGVDYPIGYVRWTETRNMEAFLRLIAQDSLDLRALITHHFPIDQATRAYELISGGEQESSLGIVITYDQTPIALPRLELVESRKQRSSPLEKSVNIGLLGAGNFAAGTLLPALKRVSNVNLIGICAANGSRSRHSADKFGFRYCATDDQQIINDTDVNAIVIATRHHLHASQVLASLRVGKHVFCEKPVCLNEEELSEIVQTHLHSQSHMLMVGFNRRFAPMAVRMKSFVEGIREPLAIHYRINAGHIPRDHWTNDPEQGGGRLLGEVCHFVDFLTFLTGAAPVEVLTRGLPDGADYSDDNLLITLGFPDGSQGTISYLANGDRAYSKERIEVFGGKSIAILDDFRSLELVRNGKKTLFRSRWRRDKGHRAELHAFSEAVINGSLSPIPFEAIVGTTLATFAAASSRRSGKPVRLDVSAFIADYRSPRPEL